MASRFHERRKWASSRPFAFPPLVGPAEMSILITLSNDNPSSLDKGLLAAASIIATLLMALTLWMSASINRLLGRTGINVITRSWR
jgi:multiple antibiotic resistance protein